MKFSRKEFIKTSALLGGGILIQGNKLLSSLTLDDSRFKTIRKNYGVFTQQGGTIGYYINDDALVVIDSQFPDSAKNLMDGLREKTSRKIDILFNTHHHGDHTSGNSYLKPFCGKIVAQENVPVLQRTRNMKPGEEDKIVTADTTFKEEYKADLSSEKITAFHIVPAHTGGDSVIHFENANIAHLGDLVFNRVFPWFNLADQGSFKSWVTYLEKIHERFDNDTVFICGHAQGVELGQTTIRKPDILVMRDYISAILDYTQKKVDAGKSEDETADVSEIPGVKGFKANWENAMQRNIREAYKELKGKK